MLKKIEKWMGKHIPWVYWDGISSMLHAFAVMAAYLVPGLSIGFALNHISGLVAGILIGGFIQYWYFMKEFGPKGDLKKIKALHMIRELNDKQYGEKKRDAYRDFGMTVISTVISLGVLIDLVLKSI